MVILYIFVYFPFHSLSFVRMRAVSILHAVYA